MRGLLTISALCALLVFPVSEAKADSDKLSVYEINKFLDKMDHSLNNPDSIVGRNFLRMGVSEYASFENTIQSVWTHPGLDYRVWYNTPSHPAYYHRYPYAYSPNYRPTSLQSLGKWEHIGVFEGKKRLVAGYSQDLNITATRMPADGRSAVIDATLKEYGLHYVPYRHGLTEKALYADSKCKLHLKKNNGAIQLTRMVCNTVSYLPI